MRMKVVSISCVCCKTQPVVATNEDLRAADRQARNAAKRAGFAIRKGVGWVCFDCRLNKSYAPKFVHEVVCSKCQKMAPKAEPVSDQRKAINLAATLARADGYVMGRGWLCGGCARGRKVA